MGRGDALMLALALQEFTFAVLGHTRGGPDDGMLPKQRYAEMVRAVQRERPDFVVLAGDLVYGDFHSATVDREAVRRDWDAVDAVFAQFGCPVHRVPGNHDVWESTTRDLWIEREDFAENPPKGYFRLSPGAMVRLRYGYVVRCTGFERDAAGRVGVVHCERLPDSRSGTPGADAYKVKGNIHWVSASRGLRAQVRLYDRLFAVPNPGAQRDYREDLNPDSCRVVEAAMLEPTLATAAPEERFQFERHGYFVADRHDSRSGAPVFNRAVTLKDGWAQRG